MYNIQKKLNQIYIYDIETGYSGQSLLNSSWSGDLFVDGFCQGQEV